MIVDDDTRKSTQQETVNSHESASAHSFSLTLEGLIHLQTHTIVDFII